MTGSKISDQRPGSTAYATLGLFTLFLVAVVVLYRERMLFVDPAWIVFNIINKKTLIIPEHRYGAFITQIVPLTGVYLHWPLKTILVAYSASFQLFYLLTAALLIFRYRRPGLALLLALYFLLFVSDAFFWPNNEVHQGIAWMFLFLGLYRRRAGRYRPHHYVLLAALGFLALFSHILVVLPFSFLWLYFFVTEARERRKGRPLYTWLCYSGYLALLFGIKYRLASSGWYDGTKLDGVKRLDIPAFFRSFGNPQARDMYAAFFSDYWLVPLIFVTGLAALIRGRRYLPALLTLCYSAGYFALVCITYPAPTTPGNLFYMQSEWMGLAIIISAPLVLYILPRIKKQEMFLLALLIFGLRVTAIAEAIPRFRQRRLTLEHMVAALQETAVPKAILKQEPQLEEALIMSWGLPVESLFAATLNGGHTITLQRRLPGEPVTQAADSFISCFSTIHYRELNPLYFPVDTTQRYREVSYQQIMPGAKAAGTTRQ